MTTVQSRANLTALSAKQAPLSPAVLPDLAYTPDVARATAHLYELSLIHI